MQPDAAFVLDPGTSREYLLHHGVCPIGFTTTGALLVMASDKASRATISEIEFLYRRPVELEEARQEEVERTIERLTNRSERKIELHQIQQHDEAATDVRNLAHQAPVVRYVNLVVRDAYDSGASDIHLEATSSGLRARFRLDGVLTPAPEPPAELERAVVSRLKLLAELDIAERRRPQDGRIRVRLDERELDIRISTVPTMYGESVVMRLLERGGGPVAVEDLGMPAEVHAGMSNFLRRSHGLLLVTGPTGSGKTTTMYAALRTRNAAAEKIVTVEDPIEYQLEGVTQVPVHRQGGVTFASALRSILRQDPDVVMIGEIRDEETAEICIQAAMTGHLVIATLHTNDAVGAIPRLTDLNVAPFLIAATLNGVIAQRLVRRICPDCRQTEPASGDMEKPPGSRPTWVRASGCDRCRGTGYRGRLGLFEYVAVNDVMRAAIMGGSSTAVLRSAWAGGGSQALKADGMNKAAAGMTTMDEVLRVTAND
jgi:general secretion pathway protein E